MRAIGLIFVSAITLGVLMLAFAPVVEFIFAFVEGHPAVVGTPLEGSIDGLRSVILRWAPLAMILAPILGAVSWALRKEAVTTGVRR